MTPLPALSLRALTKRYDGGLLALDNFDLEIPDGEFFGLLGPNGAGKTTLISAVCNLIRITSGRSRSSGSRIDDPEARRMMGLAEQDVNLDRFLDVEETLVYHGGYYGMSRPHAVRRAREMMDVFDLRAKAGVRAPSLSGGMRRRLLLARALMHEPRLVILDEPTAGVDFELRLELWRYIRRLHERGHDDPAHHPLPRGSRGALPGRRPDPRRPVAGPRQPGRAAGVLRRGLAGRRLRQGDGGSGMSASAATEERLATAPPGLLVRRRGLISLAGREVLRVLKLWTQTVAAPVVASFLFILVFGLSLSGRIRHVDGFDYRAFIVPGLITMAMVQAAYTNNASSVFQSRFDRYLNDVLASPMRNWEINLGLSLGGVVRALLIGVALLMLALPITHVPIHDPLVLVVAVVLGLTLFSSLGVVVGIYAKTWDHAGFVQNILIVPLSFLGGVFYSVSTLPAPWKRGVSRQSDLLPGASGALRISGHERRAHRDRPRDHRGAGGSDRRLERLAVSQRAQAQALRRRSR